VQRRVMGVCPGTKVALHIHAQPIPI